MKRRQPAFPVRLVLDGFLPSGALNLPIVAGILILTAIQALLVVVGAYVDGTLHMPGEAKGLLNHYGAWATLITDPLLVLSAAFACHQFRVAMSTLPVASSRSAVAETQSLTKSYFEFLHLKRNGAAVYSVLVVIGLLSWINNLYQTSDPTKFFGHDVFDSTNHLFGFTAHKFSLFVSWVVIYPAVGFLIVSMCVSTRMILESLKRRDLMAPNVTHPDGCYGFRSLGTLNIWLLLPYLLAFSVIFSVIVTHERTYASAEIPLVILTFIFLAASVMTIQPILLQAKSIQSKLYNSLVEKSVRFKKGRQIDDILFGIERICFGMADGSPYSKNAKVVLLAMRIAPIVLTAIKIFER